MTAQKKPLSKYEVVPQPRGHALHRNGKPLTTPNSVEYILPNAKLAEALIHEWRQQGEKPKPETMPLMQLASTTIDITRKDRQKIIEQLSGYAAIDLLCHRATHPEELVHREQKLWNPILDWCLETLDAPLHMGQGIMPVEQPPEALRALRHEVAVCDDFALTGLKQTAEITHSLVLGLALMKKHINAEQAFNAAECDTLFQLENWGVDPVTVARHNSIRADLAVCEKWFRLLTS